jgi:hypothetical protein
VAYNASDIGMRSFVRVVDAADPLAKLRHNATQALYSRAANASSSLADAAVAVVVGEAARQGMDLPAAVAAKQAEEGGGDAMTAEPALEGQGEAAGGASDGVLVQGGGVGGEVVGDGEAAGARWEDSEVYG